MRFISRLRSQIGVPSNLFLLSRAPRAKSWKVRQGDGGQVVQADVGKGMLPAFCLDQWFSKCGLRESAVAPKMVLEMQVLSISAESETLGLGSSYHCVNKASG